MRITLDEGAILPTRAHKTDAGLDLYSRDTKVINGGCSAVFDTGVHVEIPQRCFGLIASKSGLNVNHGITSDGIIDEGYTGSVTVKLYNHSGEPYTVHKGDKISQLIVIPCLYEDVEVVGRLDDTERGDNGFGSTGVR